MSVFDQRNQTVQYQYNAAGNINFGAVSGKSAMSEELLKLIDELKAAKAAAAIDDDTAIDVEYQLKKASQEAAKPAAAKPSLLDHLKRAKQLIEQSAPKAVGIAVGIAGAIEKISQLF